MRNDEQRLDDVDREIVRQLQQDGRRSYREMARSMDVSEGTVRWRVKRLQDTGAPTPSDWATRCWPQCFYGFRRANWSG
jgi:predicted transcriptional regulator